MATFAHFLLTRYAVADRLALLSKSQGRLDAAWFVGRLAIFQRQALRSVLNQTTRDFRWLLFYSPEYANWLRPLDALISPDYDHFIRLLPVREHWGACEKEMLSAMRAMLHDETHVISTRLDTDDTIAPDFLSLVQAQFAGQRERTFVDFPEGLLIENGTVKPYHYPGNCFQSVIEPASDARGIYAWHHSFTCWEGPVIRLPYHDRWTVLYHELNSESGSQSDGHR